MEFSTNELAKIVTTITVFCPTDRINALEKEMVREFFAWYREGREARGRGPRDPIDGRRIGRRPTPPSRPRARASSWPRCSRSARSDRVAITYTNNDYGKGLADAIQSAFEELGGEVTISAAHEDGKADYGAEVASLASAGGDALVVAGYVDQGGRGIIQASLDTGAFDVFALPDGMVGPSLTEELGADLDGSFGTVPGTDSPGAEAMAGLAEEAGVSMDGPYVGESYDAAALLLLAMQAAGSTDAGEFAKSVEAVANAPGEKIYPGELAKALEILEGGGEIDYDGATAVELIDGGDTAGAYREVEVVDGAFDDGRSSAEADSAGGAGDSERIDPPPRRGRAP